MDDLDPDFSDLEHLVLVEEHPVFSGCLLFRSQDYSGFYSRYSGWMSRHQVLSELFSLGSFVSRLEADGYTVVFGASTTPVIEAYERFSEPLEIPGYSLYPFQNFAIRQALERVSGGTTNGDRFFFWNWAAGAGKSYIAGVAARVLFQFHQIDLVIAVTTAKLKINLSRFIEAAGVQAVINDSSDPDLRRRRYFQDPHPQCFVMNFEKLRLDFEELADLTSGKRVLFILDEAHRLINDEGHNQARKCLDKLTIGCTATVWPMSATVVDGNPLRYRDVYSLDGFPRRNPLGSKVEFCNNYASSVKSIPIKAKNGGRFNLTKYAWDHAALHEVRHRVAGRTMAVRKSDDALKDTFQGLECLPVYITPSEQTRALYGLIQDDAQRLIDEAMAERERDGEALSPALAQHYMLMRMVGCTARSLTHSSSELGIKLGTENTDLLAEFYNAKLDVLNDMLVSIRESGDKAVVFCHWNEMGVQLLAPRLRVPNIVHHGEMSPKQADRAIQSFKDDPDITALFTTDAGAEGLNLQCARYVINVDPTYSYDKLYQRNSRIDRSDSHLDGLTSYVLINEGSIEERIWGICEDRRRLAEAVQGTSESLSYEGRAQRSENENMLWLLFGKED